MARVLGKTLRLATAEGDLELTKKSWQPAYLVYQDEKSELPEPPTITREIEQHTTPSKRGKCRTRAWEGYKGFRSFITGRSRTDRLQVCGH